MSWTEKLSLTIWIVTAAATSLLLTWMLAMLGEPQSLWLVRDMLGLM